MDTNVNDEYEQSPLARAVAKARGDILTEADMKANIDFLNDAAGKIKSFSDLREQPESLQLLIEFREHLNRRISELSSPSSPPELEVTPEAKAEVPRIAGRLTNLNFQGRCDHRVVLTASCDDCRTASAELEVTPSGEQGEWRLSEPMVNRAIADGIRGGANITAIDIPYPQGRKHYGQVVVFESPELAAQIVREHNAVRALYEACKLALTTPGMIKGREVIEAALALVDSPPQETKDE